jgi:hypothetical protein
MPNIEQALWVNTKVATTALRHPHFSAVFDNNEFKMISRDN